MGNSLKISKKELQTTDTYNEEIEKQNSRLIYLRKKHIFQTLREATLQRIKTSKNIEKWIGLLESKIFDPENIAEMDLNKAIALFKYLCNINLKMLSESNKLEGILSNYIKSGAMDTIEKLEKPSDVKQEREQLKNEIFTRMMKLIHKDSDDAEVVTAEDKASALSEEEVKELSGYDTAIDEDLAAIDEDIDIDIDIDEK